MQPEDVAHAVEGSRGDHLERPAGHDLLGGLEQQPDAARERRLPMYLRERDAGADETSGVDVVPARVGDPVRPTREVLAAAVLHRQRVEVRAEPDQRPVGGPHLGEQAALRQQLHLHARAVEVLGDHRGGALLLPGQLRVRMQIPTQRHQLVLEAVDGVHGSREDGRGHDTLGYPSAARGPPPSRQKASGGT